MTRSLLLSVAVALVLAGCDKPGAWGDANSIVLATSPDLWSDIEADVYASLEPTTLTVRDEKMFTVTYQNPGAQGWGYLRRFTQMLLVGDRTAPWVAEALDKADEVPAPPAVFQVRDVWSRGQLVTVALLPPDGQPGALAGLLPDLRELYEVQYRDWAQRRMFVSGRNDALSDSLMESAGFSLTLPEVYRYEVQDSVYIFRNDNPDPSELIRQIAVTWTAPARRDFDADSLLAQREALVRDHYVEPQLTELGQMIAEPHGVGGNPGYQIQAVWQNTPEARWPAAGPFLLRAVSCPSQNRAYLIDAWLYAPGKEKYEYMIQLETILDSFRCGAPL